MEDSIGMKSNVSYRHMFVVNQNNKNKTTVLLEHFGIIKLMKLEALRNHSLHGKKQHRFY